MASVQAPTGSELIFKIMGYFPSDATWEGWLGWHLMSPTMAAQQMVLCPRGRGVKSALHLTQAIENQPCTGFSLKQMSWMQRDELDCWYCIHPLPFASPVSKCPLNGDGGKGENFAWFLLLALDNGSAANAACGPFCGHCEHSAQKYL